MDYWQTKLRNDASRLESLKYFKPQFMSLQVTHPIWSTCGSNSYEVCKAIVQARMLSGRYRTDHLIRHFSNNDGSCTLCKCSSCPGSIEHLLLKCSALNGTRTKLLEDLSKMEFVNERTKSFIKTCFQREETALQLLLDSSVLSQVISIVQLEGPQILNELFYFSRSWCYTIHKTRQKLQGRWLK